MPDARRRDPPAGDDVGGDDETTDTEYVKPTQPTAKKRTAKKAKPKPNPLYDNTILGTSTNVRCEIERFGHREHGLVIPKAPVVRLIREVCAKVSKETSYTATDYRWSVEAIEALHAAGEDHLVQTFQNAELLRAHRAQATLMPDDMRVVPFINSHGASREPMFRAEVKRVQKYIDKRPENKDMPPSEVEYMKQKGVDP